MEADKQQFKRSLNLFDSTAIVIGSMIGSGIFIVSADMARNLGSPGWLLMTWLITGVMTIFAALSYGELAGMMPKAGGQYVYLKEAYNPLLAFLYGWTLFMVIQTGTIAAVAMGFAKFTGVLIPIISEKVFILNFGFLRVSSVQLLAISTIVFLTWINLQGITIGKYVQNSFTYLKVGILLLFIVIGIFVARNSEAIQQNSLYFWQAVKPNSTTILSGIALFAAIGISSVGSLFSSDAWNNITFTAGEVKNPQRNIPLSLLLGTLIVTALYILVNIIYMLVLPLRGVPEGLMVIEKGMQFADNDRVGTAAMYGIFGAYAAVVMAVLVMISTFGCNNGLILTGARVYYVMANDKLFFNKAANLNQNGVPSFALKLQALWAAILCLSGSYSQLLDYVIFAVLLFYILTIAGVFVLRVKAPDVPRPYKAFGYPVFPALYILMALFIMIVLLIYKPSYTFPGLVIVLIGVPVYFVWRKISKTK